MQLSEKVFSDNNSRIPSPIAFKFDMVIDNTKIKCPIMLGGNTISKMAAASNYVKKCIRNSRIDDYAIPFKFDMVIDIAGVLYFIFGGNSTTKIVPQTI